MPERYFNPRMYATNAAERCPVMIYKMYLEKKPVAMKQPESPFYLACITNPKSDVWYKNSPLGVHSLGNFMKSMASKANLTGKFTNHSARRTMITTLRHENISPLDISQLSGHKNLKSIDTYSEASEEQQRKMSLILSGKGSGHVKPLELRNTNVGIVQNSQTTTSKSSASTSLLSDVVFNNCTISFNCPGVPEVFNSAKPRKFRRIIESDDEEE